MMTHDDIMAYLVGAVQRIESQLISEQPPPWALKLVERIERLEKIERERQNGHSKLRLYGDK